ncbi:MULTISPECIES: PH domain-containing protein [unclassified Shinella]|uniref:PH domain-containing protein n=1 Tax=unclassified Shinella TaxID=2643062 RepID=UPI001FD8B576|nr:MULTISPECIES: PH domain-containing protein [unclassified Shinella]
MMSNVGVSMSFSIFYWCAALIWTTLAAIATGGVGILLFFVFLWRKVAVINRTKIIFENNTNRLTVQHGRWFIKDDDVVPVKAIDNVKLNRSILGKIFGWCDIMIETRSEAYVIKYVSTRMAETFRNDFLARV